DRPKAPAWRYIFCGTFRPQSAFPGAPGFTPWVLAVSEHTALRSSDFPLPRRRCPGERESAARQRSPVLPARVHDRLLFEAGQTDELPTAALYQGTFGWRRHRLVCLRQCRSHTYNAMCAPPAPLPFVQEKPRVGGRFSVISAPNLCGLCEKCF